MRKFSVLALALAGTTAANAAVTVDGVLDASYGAATAVVGQSDSAVYSNFSTPANVVKDIGYSIYLQASAGAVYGFVQTQGPGLAIGTFANLYFDLDPANNNGSDIGFELSPGVTGNHNFFIAGVGSPAAVTGLSIAQSADGTGLEFSIPNSFFVSYQSGFSYVPGQQLAAVGSDVVLRLSQSYGYSVAGGASYGPNRLGRVTLEGAGAVPEPASWAMMVGGFGLLGATLRRRKAVIAVA